MAKREIISQQISQCLRGGNINPNHKIYLSFALNEAMLDYLQSEKQFSGLGEPLTKEERQLIFSESQIEYMSAQLKETSLAIEKIPLPDNVIIWNHKKEKSEIKGDGTRMAYYHIKERIFLSIPVITKNKEYALIVFSQGLMGRMGGGINLYKKENGKWAFYKCLEGWIS